MFQPDENWSEATPQDIPDATYWPAVLALGIALIFWGFLTVFFISLLGIVVFSIALTGWIAELRHEMTTNNYKDSSDES